MYLQLWFRHNLENMTHNPKKTLSDSAVWTATLLLSLLIQLMWYCYLTAFLFNDNSTILTMLKKLSSKWSSLSFFLNFFSVGWLVLPKQPLTAPNLVPLEPSFNHQTNFSLFSVKNLTLPSVQRPDFNSQDRRILASLHFHHFVWLWLENQHGACVHSG